MTREWAPSVLFVPCTRSGSADNANLPAADTIGFDLMRAPQILERSRA